MVKINMAVLKWTSWKSKTKFIKHETSKQQLMKKQINIHIVSSK